MTLEQFDRLWVRMDSQGIHFLNPDTNRELSLSIRLLSSNPEANPLMGPGVSLKDLRTRYSHLFEGLA